MIKINRLLAKTCSHLNSGELDLYRLSCRVTGESTAYLLSLLGEVLSNPNEKFYIRKSQYGEKARHHEFKQLQSLVAKLELNFIEFCRRDLSVSYHLYDYYEGTYDMYRKLGGLKDA